MELSTPLIIAGIITALVAAILYVLLLWGLARCVTPKKATPKSVLIGAVGTTLSLFALSCFLLLGVPYRNDNIEKLSIKDYDSKLGKLKFLELYCTACSTERYWPCAPLSGRCLSASLPRESLAGCHGGKLSYFELS
uniref:Uncharacterized protein n=1 Tax=Caenorhabditis japonica TaxID=281687 RepID=A0A8R1E6T8_CAEJA